MTVETLQIEVVGQDRAESNDLARQLADRLVELEGVERAERAKSDPDAMDVGYIVNVIVGSGAMLALARGLADWLRARSGATLVLGRSDRGTPSATIKGVDAATAERMLDLLLRSRR